ncbi:5618_t:CDS:10 [Entrophospora sp. SA101]|nr:9544_t:CDS:10 [Entrophospora sp. SA101]CAJ0889001.1 5618_t:CDS:10 [Entrophospora sp. SA101]
MSIEKFEKLISKNIYNKDVWEELLVEVKSKDEDKVRYIYEKFLQHFPTSPKQWIQYAEYELKNKNFDKVESIFTRCIRTVLSVDLCKFYLNYILEKNTTDSGAISPEARDIIIKAYEFVIHLIGLDKDSGTIWNDYIQFIKTGETHNTWAEQQKMDTLRKIYQKAICIPLNNVEQIWKEYDQFENSLNKLTAKKILHDKSPSYMTARTTIKELRKITDKIVKNIIPVPPKWTKQEKEQLSYWKDWIDWEKSNPLSLEDQSALSQRVMYAYKQAMMYLRFYPELWFEASNYLQSVKKEDEAVSTLKNATEIMPTSFLIHFAYADLQEDRKQFEEARNAFKSLLDRLQEKIKSIEEATAEEINELNKPISSPTDNSVQMELDGETREQLRTKEKEKEKERAKIEENKKNQINEIAKSCGLIWIMQMRFERRIGGMKAARTMFSKARKSPYCTHHVFIASAMMEYHCNKDLVVAGKIFELGLKTFINDPDYVVQYLDFLISLNDDNNALALFERALLSIPSDKAKILWKKFSDYENNYGDLASIYKINERQAKEYPEAKFETTKLSSIIESPQIEEEKESAPVRRALLDSVHPEKYPRPDFRQWVPYKPAEQLRRQQQQAPTTQNVTGTTHLQHKKGTANISQPIPNPLTWTMLPNGLTLPDSIAKFLVRLPPPTSYTGPFINVDTITDLIRNINFPIIPTASGVITDRTRGDSPSRADGRVRQGEFFGKQNRGQQPTPNTHGGSDGSQFGKRRRKDFETEYGPVNIFLNLEQRCYRSDFAPRKTKYCKAHKGRVPVRVGGSTKGNTIVFGEYRLRITHGVCLTSAQLTAAHNALNVS